VKCAPGPGTIHKADCAPIAQEYLRNRKIVLHTDSARSYKAKVKGVAHDAVVHCEKKQTRGGKVTWSLPQYVRVDTNRLPDGKTLKVKAGTKHVDCAWRFLKDLRRNQRVKAGTKAIRAAIRSAQYECWNRGADLWLKTGELVMSEYLFKFWDWKFRVRRS